MVAYREALQPIVRQQFFATAGVLLVFRGPADINGVDCKVVIGEGCDLGAFLAINCADSHKRCLGLSEKIDRRPITLEPHVFVGTHCVIKGGAYIGHHCVVAAGTVVESGTYPPWSLIYMGADCESDTGPFPVWRRKTVYRDGYYRPAPKPWPIYGPGM